MRGFVAVVATVCCGGCSMYMDEVPKGWDPSQGQPACSTSTKAATADFAVALPLLVASTIFFGIGLSDGDDLCGDHAIGPEHSCAIGVGTLLAAMPHAWSGFHGATTANRCRRAKAAARAWDADHVPMTMRQRIELERRRAAVRRRTRRWGSLECADLVDEWREESDKVHQQILFDRLPEDCRSRIRVPHR